MTLLEFVRGPVFAVSLAVFLLGTAWRLYGIFSWPSKPDYSEPRRTDTAAGACRAILRHMWPRREFQRSGGAQIANAYAYHIGLFLVVFTFAPHIGFVRRLTGIAWPALPDAVTYLATAVAIVGLLIALMSRLTNGVQRLLSNFDDYFSWVVTMLPLVTGMAVLERPYVPAPVIAPALPTNVAFLAIHLLSLELLFVWFPFGKLMHAVLAFVSRARTGADFTRKGVAL